MTSTPFARVGRIVSAPRDPAKVGFYIEVVDDSAGSTGGAYILTWLNGVGFDDWVESAAFVDAAMDELSYAVEWFETPPPDSITGRHRHA